MYDFQSRADLVARLTADASGFTAGMKDAERSAQVFMRELDKQDAKIRQHEQAMQQAGRRQAQAVAHVAQMRQRHEQAQMRLEQRAAAEAERRAAERVMAQESIGRAMLGAGAAAAAGVALAARAAVEWESAFAGVAKTTDLTGLSTGAAAAAMGVLEDELRELAKTLPSSHTEIAAVAEAAGQLGIRRQDVAGFTRTMIDLGETTNLSAQDAATALARISNIMGTSASDVDRLGSALVALGNDGASTEAEIVEMALRIAGAGKQLGLTEGEVLGVANALSSVGIEAEAGGSAISRVLIDMAVAVDEGGAKLDKLAEVAGVSAQEFATSFGQDAAGGLGMFVDGLGRMTAAGESTFQVLDELGFAEIRTRDSLLRLSNAQGLLTDSTRLGNEAWAANSALAAEAEKRYETTAAKMQIAKNNLTDLGISIGTTLLPALAEVVEAGGDVAAWLGDLPAPVQALLAVLGTLTATVGVLGGAAMIAVPKLVAFRASIDAIATSSPRAAGALGFLGGAMTKLGAAAGIAGAVAGVAIAVDQLLEATAKEGPGLNALTESLADFARTGETSGALARVVGEDFEGLKDKITTANKAKWDVFDGAGIREVITAREELEQLDGALAALVQNGNAEVAGEALAAAGLSAEWAAKTFPAYAEALAGARTEAKLAEDGIAGVGDAAQAAAPQVAELTDAQKSLEQALSSFVDPLGAYNDLVRESAEATAASTADAGDSWSDYAETATVSLDQLAERLEQDNQAHAEWEQNLVTVAQTAGADVANILAGMGEEGVRLTAAMADGSAEEVARMADALRTNAAIGGEGAARELDAKMQVMAAIAASGGKATVESLAAQLGLGTAQIAAIAAQYGVTLAQGVNPVLLALGRPGILAGTSGRARHYADGGMHEEHVAQIAPAGAWRVWAEPETGGEAYIPLAPAKRQRSVGIWQETGRRLGVYADGGFHAEGDVPRPPSTRPYGPPLSTAADQAMLAAYGETVDFVKKHAAPQLTAGIGFQAMMAALRTRFPGLPLNSGLRPGAITATGNQSLHALGRAVDVPPRMDVFDWIAEHYGPRTRELIFSPAGGRQLRNGRPHMYGEPTRSMHFDHVHWAMAKGGILNPHVRDTGGPLLPGFTFNGTGRPEMVLPMADGGILPSVSTSFGGLHAAVASLTDPAAIRQAIELWEKLLRLEEEAARRAELVAEMHLAEAEAAKASADSQVAAQERVRAATLAVQDFDLSRARDNERLAVDALLNSLHEEAEAREEAKRAAEDDYRLRVEVNDNLFELGRISVEDHLANLDRRMARELEFTDEWMSLYQQRQRVLAEQADAERKAAEEAARAQADLLAYELEIAQNRYELGIGSANAVVQALLMQLSGLTAFSDEWMSVWQRIVEFTGEAGDALSQAVKGDVTNVAERLKISVPVFRSATRAIGEGFSDAASNAKQAASEIEEAAERILDSLRLDQRTTAPWANTTDQLIKNAQDQFAQLQQWKQALMQARAAGLSQAVIESLGLDDGPQGLSQLRSLLASPADQIRELNSAVAARGQAASSAATFLSTPASSQAVAGPGGPVSVKVIVGDRELRDIVGVEVNGRLTDHRVAYEGVGRMG